MKWTGSGILVDMGGRRRGDPGFSLAEMIMSIGILSTALLLVVGVFTYLFNASQKAVDMTAGTVVSGSVMQGIVNRINYDTATNTAFFQHAYAEGSLIETGTYKLNQADFTYRIYAHDVGALTLGAQMKQLTVVCTWWDSGGSVPGGARAGFGQLQVEMTRFMLYGADY